MAGVLVGPGTLFMNENSECRKNYFDLKNTLYSNFDYKNYSASLDLDNRKKISDVINNCGSSNHQVAIFTVGTKTRAAIHSEPNMTQKRLFYSIVSGNSNDIKNLADFHKKQFIE